MIDEIRKKIKEENPFLADREISDFDVYKLWDFTVEKKNCIGCKGLEECKNDNKGYTPKIDDKNNIQYCRCDFAKKAMQEAEHKNNLNLMYLPDEIMNASFSDFFQGSDDRRKCYMKAMRFLSKLDNHEYEKGLYISGDGGAGKTFFMASLANELLKRNHKVTFVYFPGLVNELRADINKMNDTIFELKTAEFLFIDDLGVGSMTQWVRDSILVPVLDYRMAGLKPLFISSNVDENELKDYLTLREDNLNERPYTRIFRRIKSLCSIEEMAPLKQFK